MNTNLPDHRVLCASTALDRHDDPQPYFGDGAEEPLQAVLDAVHGGRQLRLASNHDDLHLLEVCMTEFTDPATGERRYAVEAWNNHAFAKHDFAFHPDASARYHYYYDELNLETHATRAPAA